VSLFDSDFEAAAGDLLTQLADTVTYTPNGGAGVSVSAIVGRDVGAIEETDYGTDKVRRRVVVIPTTSDAADGGNYIAAPSHQDTVTISGVEYSVEDTDDAITLDGCGLATVKLVDRRAAEIARKGYRGPARRKTQ